MPTHRTRQPSHHAETEFRLAFADWKRGNRKGAFRRFVTLAAEGETAAFLNVGYCYDAGIGVRKDVTEALRWYRRAYRTGDPSAAHNIGIIYRDREECRRAVAWFQRALRLGSDDSAVEIARIDRRLEQHSLRAVRCVRLVIASEVVSESDRKAARTLRSRAVKRRRRSQRP
jgi:uncharacterized protein